MADTLLPARIHIVGRRNAGKTTLVCDLVCELSSRGLHVATVKHTHHHHELDTPGKDSWKHRDAGACGVGILSPQMMAAFVPTDRKEQVLDEYSQLSRLFGHCDLLLVEGDLHTNAKKVEVWRDSVDEPPYACSEQHDILAVISDTEGCFSGSVWPRHDIKSIADQVLKEVLRD